MNKKTLNNIVTITVGLIIGIYLIYTSYMVLSDIPEKNNLLWLSSAEVSDVVHSGGRNDGSVSLYGIGGSCLTISSKKDGFGDLYDAIESGRKYTIGYNQERKLFSNNADLHSMVYEINVNDQVVMSFENHVSTQRILFLFIGGGGLFVIFGTFYEYKKQTGDIEKEQNTENQTSHSSSEDHKHGGRIVRVVDALAGVIGLVAIGSAANYLKDYNIPIVVTYSAVFSIGSIIALLFNRKKMDRDRKITGILAIFGLGIMFASTLVTTYVVSFFKLNMLHVALALLPAFIHAGWVSYRDKSKEL